MSNIMKNPNFEPFIGYTQKQKTLDEIYKYIQEDRIKSMGYRQKFMPLSLGTAFDPETDEITSIGCSDPADIINNNMGILMSGCFRDSTPINGRTNVSLTDQNGTARTVWTYGNFVNASFAPFNGTNYGSIASQVQVGTGTNPPTRSDLTVQTPFIGGPEAGRVDSVAPGGTFIVAAEQIQISAIITPTSQAGTVQETCLFGFFTYAGGAEQAFCFSRDLITIAFGAGQSISVSYIWNI